MQRKNPNQTSPGQVRIGWRERCGQRLPERGYKNGLREGLRERRLDWQATFTPIFIVTELSRTYWAWRPLRYQHQKMVS